MLCSFSYGRHHIYLAIYTSRCDVGMSSPPVHVSLGRHTPGQSLSTWCWTGRPAFFSIISCLCSLVRAGSSFDASLVLVMSTHVKLQTCYLEFGLCICSPDSVWEFHIKDWLYVCSMSSSTWWPPLSEDTDPTQKHARSAPEILGLLPPDDISTPRDEPSVFQSDDAGLSLKLPELSINIHVTCPRNFLV